MHTHTHTHILTIKSMEVYKETHDNIHATLRCSRVSLAGICVCYTELKTEIHLYEHSGKGDCSRKLASF